MANALTHKLGPLQTWQWLAIGGGGGLLLYLYEKNHKTTEEPTSELAGSTGNPLTGGGGGGETGNGSQLATPGPVGEPGPAGAPGTPAAEIDPTRLDNLESAVERLNNPPVGSQTVAPIAATKQYGTRDFTRETLSGKTGAEYKTKTVNGKLAHVFDTAVKGGVGKGKNIVYLAKHGGTGHTAKPSHAKAKPLKVKAKAPVKKAPAKKAPAKKAPAKKAAKKRK